MTELTLLQQARQHANNAAARLGHAPSGPLVRVVAAVQLVLQHLEQQQAATRGPAQVPSEPKCKQCGQSALAVGIYCNGKLGHDFGPIGSKCNCHTFDGLHDEACPESPAFKPEALDLDELQRLCDEAGYGSREYDAFIAAARDALPKLIARVQELERVPDHALALGKTAQLLLERAKRAEERVGDLDALLDELRRVVRQADVLRVHQPSIVEIKALLTKYDPGG